MTPEDYNRLKAKAESWSESFLTWIIGLPPPWTAIAVLLAFILSSIGVFSII